MQRVILALLAILVLSQTSQAQVKFDSTSQLEVDSAIANSRVLDKEIGGCAALVAVRLNEMLLVNARVSYRNQGRYQVMMFCVIGEIPWHTHVSKAFSPEYLCSAASMYDDEWIMISRRLPAGIVVCGFGPDSLRIYGPAWDVLLGDKAKLQRGK